MKKSVKIFIVVIAIVLLAVVITSMALFIPLNGKKHIEIWGYKQDFDINKIETLEKKPGVDFKILQLTDIQLWFDAGVNKKALKVVTDTVKAVRPHLIVLTGDNVSGLLTDSLTKQLIKTMDSLETPWAPVFGNHDAEGKATLNWQGDRFEESEYCLFKKGPSNLYGVGNYVLNIKENEKIIQTLFFFDNGRYIDYESGNNKEVYMGYEQMAWYKWNIEGIAKYAGGVVPSMTFSHFAIPEFAKAIKEKAPQHADGRYYVPQSIGFGSCSYIPGVAEVNSGFFDLAKDLGSTHAMFFGHDHENDASILYEGIRFTYGLKAGPSPKPWNDAKEFGGTVAVIVDDYSVDVMHYVHSKA